jgi:hypothetical protein
MSTDAATEPSPPVIRVLHGDPSVEEVGVLVALLSAAGRGEAPGTPSTESLWSGPAARLGSAGPGRDSWRFSGMPR